ncbi:conserved hypothetical protein [Rhodopseudomonas palustris HaA2]|uniref:Uncharacterized protein n=2 Tax=Rhodopseudomonas palustris TaxID=1076 RepID=Q2IUC4_RHOP2|nr:conserved hypothetical protein [Rhodopseudomonas palustris HaA2]
MAIRPRASATKPAARSAVRAPRNAPAARLATIEATTRKVDAPVRIDPADTDGKARVKRMLDRAATSRTTKTPAAKKVVVTKTAANTTATKTSATKTNATKTNATKTIATKTRATKTAGSSIATKAVAKKTVANKNVADKVAAEACATDADAAETAETETVAAHGAAPPPPRRRGPSGVTRNAVERCNDPPPLGGLPLIDRVGRAAEREIERIEVIVGGNHIKPAQRTEAERRARTLASLARTLAALRTLRSDEQRRRTRDDDAIPRDLDEFRRALSRRLEQLVDGRARPPAAGDE